MSTTDSTTIARTTFTPATPPTAATQTASTSTITAAATPTSSGENPAPQFTIGLAGIGKLGTSVARILEAAGYPLRVWTRSESPMRRLATSVLVPSAKFVSWEDLVRSDVLVLAVPRPALDGLDLAGYRGIVVDATNAWEPTDGPSEMSEDGAGTSTTGLFAAAHPDLRVVKTFNHLAYTDLTAEARSSDEPGRRAMGVASDDAEARAMVATIVDAAGFDPVELTLEEGRMLEPDGPVFGNRYEAEDLRELVRASRG